MSYIHRNESNVLLPEGLMRPTTIEKQRSAVMIAYRVFPTGACDELFR
jgi:hypothetical protein